ncbi:alcohol dehydrogenase, putative, partial [Perkinsus marinus ATCC 50983]
MKAFTYSTKAGEMAWHDGDFKIPKPGRSQVQVKVLAVGMNPIDYKLPYMVPFSSRVLRNRLVGFDFSGEVTIPNGEFKAGDVVFGVTMKGSLGEYTIVDTNRIARVPEGMEYTTAAGLASSACTALTGLRKADITKSPGNVLIIGASGGVGCMAVQLAKSFGAKVWAVCSDKNEKLVTSLGADQV